MQMFCDFCGKHFLFINEHNLTIHAALLIISLHYLVVPRYRFELQGFHEATGMFAIQCKHVDHVPLCCVRKTNQPISAFTAWILSSLVYHDEGIHALLCLLEGSVHMIWSLWWTPPSFCHSVVMWYNCKSALLLPGRTEGWERAAKKSGPKCFYWFKDKYLVPIKKNVWSK